MSNLRKRMYLILSLLLFTSCASSSDWVEETVAMEDEVWNWCRADLNPPEYADKGWCFSTVRVKHRTWPRKDEEEYVTYFCEAGDINCLKKKGLTQKWLVSNPLM